MLSKEEIKEIENIGGKVRGFSLREDLEFLKAKKGEDGLEKILQTMKELGYPLEPEKIKNFDWYPWYQNILLIVLAQRVFNWGKEEFREWGLFSAQISFMAKLIMKFFVSIDRVLKGANDYWRRYFSEGKIEVEVFDKTQHLIILNLKDFPTHQLFCWELEGYFWQVASYVLPKENLRVEEIECPFSGQKDHKFKISW